MATSKEVSKNIQEEELNFSQSQLVKGTESGVVILCTGETTFNNFEGVVVLSKVYPIGKMSSSWVKANFTLYKGEIQLTQ